MSHHLYLTFSSLTSGLTAQELDDVIAACAEGYPFPANLDIDSPLGGMARESPQGLMRWALKVGWELVQFHAALAAKQERKRSHSARGLRDKWSGSVRRGPPIQVPAGSCAWLLPPACVFPSKWKRDQSGTGPCSWPRARQRQRPCVILCRY